MMSTLWRASLPLFLTMMIDTLDTLLDAFFVSFLGPQAIGAVGMYVPVMYVFIALFESTYIVSQVAVAITKGGGADDELPRVLNTSFLYGSAACTLLIVGGFVLLGQIGTSMGADGQLLVNFEAFTSVMFVSNAFSIACFILTAALIGIGDVRAPLWLGVMSLACNAALSPLLIYVVGWGVAGAAVGTLSAQAVVFVLLIWRCRQIGGMLNLSAPNWVSHPMVKDLAKSLGLPIVLSFFIISLTIWIHNMLIGPYGAEAVSGLGIGYRYHILMLLPSLALAASVRSIMGQNVGAGEFGRAHSSFRNALVLVVGLYAVISAGAWIGAPSLSAIMDDGNLQVREYTVSFLRTVTLTYPLLGCGVVALAALETAGRGFYSLMMYLGAYVPCNIVPALLLVQVMGPEGVFIAIALSPCWHFVSMSLANRVLAKQFPL